MTKIYEVLSARGWVIRKKEPPLRALPEEIVKRYPRLPSDISDFICAISECRNAAADAWSLGTEDVERSDADCFRWNELELMSYDASETTEDQRRIEIFWDSPFPVRIRRPRGL